MRITRVALVALAILLPTAQSHADCKRDLSLPGYVKARGTDTRGFTITRTGANFELVTDSMYDRLSWKIVRPNGRRLNCAQNGPGTALGCTPAGRPPGYYTIYVINKMRKDVSYTLHCSSP